MINNGQYRHSCVADLAWAVSSPPLLLQQDGGCVWYSGDWCMEQYRQIEARLHELDHNPVKLESLLAAQKDQRLGNYFETLWAYALELNPRYRLIERNLQIIDGHRTLGEMDFIVLDKDTGRYAHWELAIKFYLGVGNTIRHDAWHGPARKDRLDLKLDHLLSRQTLLSTHPITRVELEKRGIVIEDCAVILKGRLFYPWEQSGAENYPRYANPSHPAGYWLTRQQLLHSYGADARFIPLIRNGWMADVPLHPDQVFSASGLLELVGSGQCRLPLHVARLDSPEGRERLFIVNDDWAVLKT